jgi:hypothetical protein
VSETGRSGKGAAEASQAIGDELLFEVRPARARAHSHVQMFPANFTCRFNVRIAQATQKMSEMMSTGDATAQSQKDDG